MTEYLILVIAAVIVFAALAVPIALIVVVVAWVHHRRGALMAAVVAVPLILLLAASPLPRMGAGAVYAAVPAARGPLVRLDLALSRSAREEAVRLVTGGELAPGDWANDYVLPAGARGLSVHGTVQLIDGGCGPRVFFMTLTAFSPDPYAGFEYVPRGCPPEPDPLGSGHGITEDLGDGWYWIQAR